MLCIPQKMIWGLGGISSAEMLGSVGELLRACSVQPDDQREGLAIKETSSY